MRKGIALAGVFMSIVLVSGSLSACSSTSSSDSTPATATTPTPDAAAYSISGTVSLWGAGLPGVTMTLKTYTTSTTMTEAGGHYSFTGLTNGDYSITPSKTGFVFNPQDSKQTLNNGRVTGVTGVDFTATNKWDTPGIPWGVAVDSAGDVYVSELFSARIEKFTSTGTFITRWGSAGNGNSQFNWPKHIDVDGSDNLYVADNRNFRIQKFSSSGTYITQWGSYGTGKGQFNGPAGIAVDIANGWVYVADSGNSRIEKFDLAGKYITQWGRNGTGNGQFIFGDATGATQYGPEGDVEVDSTGAVYVVDNGNHRIQKFDSSGAYVAQWGSTGSSNGQFLFPVGIAIDSAGTVYVVDNSTGGEAGNVARIEEFDSAGKFIRQVALVDTTGLPANGIGVAIDRAGVLYVTQGGSIYKYAP
jgi:DNA-binding beta-propeller fold protein YncE